MSKNRKYISGFTLIELMVTLAIALILIMAGIPSFNELIRDNQTAGQANRFIADLNYARSEAVKRGSLVFVCKSSDQANCTSSSNWEDGWIVLADDGDDTIDGGDAVLIVNQGLKENFTLRDVGGNFSNWLSYGASGVTDGNGGGGVDTFRLCRPDADITQSRQIDISATGRISIREGTTTCP